jgi:hypothetical protein
MNDKIAGHGLHENLNLLALNFAVEPGLGVRPVLLDGPFGQAQNFGGFRRRHADKETQLDDLGLNRTAGGQPVERVIDRQEMVLVGRHGDFHIFNIYALQAAAVTAGEFAAGVVNEEMAHGLGGGGEEMGAIFEGRVVAADEAQPNLMHQSGGLEGVTCGAVGHLIRRELAQLRINQRQQLIGGLGVAVLDGLKNAGHVAQLRDCSQSTEWQTIQISF